MKRKKSLMTSRRTILGAEGAAVSDRGYNEPSTHRIRTRYAYALA